uniref:Histidine acid phosphatase n=1 Tax=Panagrolaimus sp. JU765 TaxID=591449 RepID=A0AC34R216_9BILA
MQDALLIEKNNNKPLPGWATDQLLGKLDQILNDTDDYETGYPGFGLPMDFELIKIRSGPLLKEIIQNMQTAKNQKNDFKKINFYSAHDVTISSFLKTLEAKTQIIGGLLPNYTATVAVELWQASNVDSNFIQEESDDFLVQ